MSTRRLRAIASISVTAVLLGAACGGAAEDSRRAGGKAFGSTSPSLDGSAGVPATAEPASGSAVAPPSADAKGTRKPPGRPALGGNPPAQAPPPGDGGSPWTPGSGEAAASSEQDPYWRRWAKGQLVISGRTEDVEWRLYAWPQDKKTCLGFHSRGPTGGGGGGVCEHRPPLGVSASRSDRGRYFYGLVGADVAHVRIDHAEGQSELLPSAGADGFAVRFFAGPVAPTPVVRVVALDADGRVVAEHEDPTRFNR